MSGYLRSEIVAALKKNNALFVVGAGVSMSATNGNSVASWNGLLEAGIERCVDLRRSLAGDWARACRDDMNSPEPADKLDVAQRITSELKGLPGNHYGKWLKDTVGQLKVSSPGIVQVLSGFKAPILTTNYDSLIEEVSGRDVATWKDFPLLQEEIQEPGKYVLHLHGHWKRPDSVIFGYKSYAEAIGEQSSQALLRSLMAVKSIVFVGFGAGLADPNFSSLGTWVASVLGESGTAPVVLVRDEELVRAEKRYTQLGYNVISYGSEYEDLEIYLADLLADSRELDDSIRIQFDWDTLTPMLMRLHRRIEKEFKPDFIVAMSGPGNVAPAYCLAHSSSDPPLLTAVTFPKRPHRSPSCIKFRDVAQSGGWAHHESTRWDVFLPNLISHFPKGARVLIFDDRAVGGRVQREVSKILAGYGYEVRRAALIVHPDCKDEVDFYEQVVVGDFGFPWGGKYGRNDPPAS
ncbi:SIR2 family protein [Lentzea fradiae]|nr:SIR2 family protein [Lentzea fradiae]